MVHYKKRGKPKTILHTFFTILALFSLASSSQLFAQKYDWLHTARIFLIDAYQPPFAPELEFDAEKLAQTMQDMHANVVRMATMGKYATIQGVSFPTHPDQNGRDLLTEMITACKPRGINVIPYISTGHKLAWSTVTLHYPDYAQRTKPGGGPERSHMYVGEDMGTVCWNTSYRQAFLDYVTHVVRDYNIDGIYFDTWRPFYFWSGKKVCYCEGCVTGFRKASGMELPWHKDEAEYTREDLEVISRYHQWYHEELIDILHEVRKIVKSYKDIPLIYNINNPDKISREDPRIINAMDAFLYERSESILQRAEGVSLAETLGKNIMPYIGGYDNWPRVVNNQVDFQQEIFTTLMFGGAPIISQPYPFIKQKENRKYVSYPFKIIQDNEDKLTGIKNYPYVAIIYGSLDPPGHAKSGWWWEAGVRTSTLGAFAACLYSHIQVTSSMITLLDNPQQLSHYKVLYLADITYLSEQQLKNIRQFVYNGGGLVVSNATSLYNESRGRNASFALEDLLKVRPIDLPGELDSYRSMIGGPNDLYFLKRKGVKELDPGWNNRLIPAWFFEPVEVLEGGKIIMDIVTGDDERPVLPGVVLSHYGKGKVLYTASLLESLFFGNHNPVLKELIATFIATVAPSSPPFTLEAPEAVMANLATDENRYVLHLTNWTGNKYENNHVVMEDYIAPVGQVRVLVNIPKKREVKSVSTMTGSPFKMEKRVNSVKLLLPSVGAYEGIVIDLR